jgi:LPS sulfotransferase NodH
LTELGAIDRWAADLYRRHGPINRPPTARLFTKAPTDAEWLAQLAGQTRFTVSASAALDAVREAWRAAGETLDDLHGSGPLPYKG